MNTSIAFFGLGLIGGTLAKAIRKTHPEYQLLAYDPDKNTLEQALKDHSIDISCSKNDPRMAQCNYIFLCAPVEYNLQYLHLLKDRLSPNCIISDVGSVKEPIHQAAKELGLEKLFIGGHPMAGSERSGYKNSKAQLLENAYFILTPSNKVTPEKTNAYKELIASLGSVPLILTPHAHDYITASISHIPHVIASSLVNLVRLLDDEEQHMKLIAAGGFRDITRIASSSPEMWEQICTENTENISQILETYIGLLKKAKDELDRKDFVAIRQMFTDSRDYRDSMDIVSYGPLKKDYTLYMDIADEAGGIATITTILAMANISIRNIGIVHNREFEQGVLRIEFYEESAMVQAISLLKKRNYIIYER